MTEETKKLIMADTMTPLQKAIIYGSTLSSILQEYIGCKEDAKAIQEVRGQIKKMMYRRSRSNKAEFMQAVSIADKAWQKAINHFAQQSISIECLSTAQALYCYADKELERFANLNQKRIDAMARLETGQTAQEIEANSYTVAEYIHTAICELTGEEARDTGLKQLKDTILKEAV